MDLSFLSEPTVWASLFTLSLMEIVLGIDNVIFISILVDRLPQAQRHRARLYGLGGALVMRVILLASIVWIIGLTVPLFTAFGLEFSWRDVILLVGGGFLLAKATIEIHHLIEGIGHDASATGAALQTFGMVIFQIMLLDVVFSLDSVLTAIGMAQHLPIMITAVVLAMGVMVFAARPIGDFISAHPTTKMLALAFLLLIGVALIADGLDFHIPRGYLYFGIAFSALVEALNLLVSARRRRHAAQANLDTPN